MTMLMGQGLERRMSGERVGNGEGERGGERGRNR